MIQIIDKHPAFYVSYSLYLHMCIKCPTEYLELYMDYKSWPNINIKMYNNIVCAD